MTAEDDLNSEDVSELTAQLDLALESVQEKSRFSNGSLTHKSHPMKSKT